MKLFWRIALASTVLALGAQPAAADTWPTKPVRMVVPKRYAWKGAKWLKAIELHEFDRPGFWEVRGYHNDAFPFEEQRFTDEDY